MDELRVYDKDSIAMKAKFQSLSTQQEKDALVADFVDRLKRQGLTSDEIKKVLSVEYITDAQSNRILVSLTSAYKVAVAKALGTKI